MRTESEELFKRLCMERGIKCERIPEGTERTADYSVDVHGLSLIVEVKQLDENDNDRDLTKAWATPDSPGAVAPSDRVRAALEDGYPQVKRSAKETHPTMIVVYNNSGEWNWIDAFAVSKAMFGMYGIVLGLSPDKAIVEVGRGYMGERTVTKCYRRSLSVVGVLRREKEVALDCYHNPFATLPIAPSSLSSLATAQYVHPDPHARGFVSWKPIRI